jgi:extradiol dioxygenase family protein
VPEPDFGLIPTMSRFREPADRLCSANIEFVVGPYVRFEGQTGEQWTIAS